MSFDQTMRIIEIAGTWFAGVGTFAAAAIAIWLARRSEQVKLQAYVGLRILFGTGVREDCLVFCVTNIGERPVTVNSIGWSIGKGKNRMASIQTLSNSSPDQYPKKIDHGESAMFMVKFAESPGWITEFVERFVSDRPLKTLRAQIHTSVRYTEVLKPEENLIMQLQEAQDNL